MCKNISYEFYCEEPFTVKHKSKYSCESAIYFNLDSEIIKENCNFACYFNKTDIKPSLLDGGNENIIEYNVNNDIPIKIPSFLYVLLNQSVLYSCEIEADLKLN